MLLYANLCHVYRFSLGSHFNLFFPAKFVYGAALNAQAQSDACERLFFVFQGGRNVLCLYGYSNQQPDGLSFPDDVIDPDVGRVAAVTLEVMSLRMELEMLLKV